MVQICSNLSVVLVIYNILRPKIKIDKCLHLSGSPKVAMVIHLALQIKSHPKNPIAPTVGHFGISLVAFAFDLCLGLWGTLLALLRIGQESIGCCLAQCDRHQEWREQREKGMGSPLEL